MKSPAISIFGVPIKNYTSDEVANACIEHLVTASSTSQPLFINPVAAKDITSVFGWLPKTIDDPESLQVLRRGNMNIAQGKGLQRISRALGCPLKPAVDVKELLLKICTKLGAREKGVFILGSKEKLHKAAAVNLHEMCPGLRVVGIVTHPIHIKGEDLVNADERDELLIEQMNATNADLLVIALEESKQNLWLERVHRKLKIPLVICVSDVLDELAPADSAAKESAAPSSPTGWWRKACTGLKTLGIALPLIAYHRFNRLCAKILTRKRQASPSENSQLFLSQQHAIAIVTLPEQIDASTIQSLSRAIEDAKMHDILVLDFQAVRHIQPEGFYMLLCHWQQQRHEKRKFYGFRPTQDIIFLMQLHRVWNYFRVNTCMSTETLLARVGQTSKDIELFDSVYQYGDFIVISFLGALNSAVNDESYLQRLKPLIGNKNCQLDFSYCSYIDTSGFTLLLKIRQLLHEQHKQLILCSLNKSLRRQFKRVGIAELFRIV